MIRFGTSNLVPKGAAHSRHLSVLQVAPAGVDPRGNRQAGMRPVVPLRPSSGSGDIAVVSGVVASGGK
jgi:hypothetical protein